MQKAEKQNVMKDENTKGTQMSQDSNSTNIYNMEDSPLICKKGLNTMLLITDHCYYDQVVAIILIKLCYAEGKPFELTQSFYTALLSIRHSLLLDIITLGVISHCWYLT